MKLKTETFYLFKSQVIIPKTDQGIKSKIKKVTIKVLLTGFKRKDLTLDSKKLKNNNVLHRDIDSTRLRCTRSATSVGSFIPTCKLDTIISSGMRHYCINDCDSY